MSRRNKEKSERGRKAAKEGKSFKAGGGLRASKQYRDGRAYGKSRNCWTSEEDACAIGASPRRSRRHSKDERHPHKHIPESLRSYITGTVDMKSSGKAYIIPDNKEIEDVYIAPNNIGHSLHGDYVRVLLFPWRAGHRMEGQIVEVLKRNKHNIVGTVDYAGKYAFLIPDSTNVVQSVFLPQENLCGAKQGQKVVARIEDWPAHLNNPIGKVTAILGRPGENNVEMQSILAEFDFPLSYPQEAIDEAAKMSEKVTPKELAARRDFRDIYTCTIDPADAKDFDDALSYRLLPNGNREVGVHIADVSHFVKPGSAIDAEAYERATSVYLVDRTIPMLPERLCNNLCSLNPDVDRFCFSVLFEMDNKAQIKHFWIGKGLIHSNRRFTYEEAQAILESVGLAEKAASSGAGSSAKMGSGDTAGGGQPMATLGGPAAASTEAVKPLSAKSKIRAAAKAQAASAGSSSLERLGSPEDIEAICELFKLSRILRDKRFKTGAINFHSQEVRFQLEPGTAKPLGVYIKESKESNHLVEEFMLLANRRVAELIGKCMKVRQEGNGVYGSESTNRVGSFDKEREAMQEERSGFGQDEEAWRDSLEDFGGDEARSGRPSAALVRPKKRGKKALPGEGENAEAVKLSGKVKAISGKPKTFVYRVHDEPNPERLATFTQFVGKLGYKMNLKSRSGLVKSFNNLLESVEGKAEQNMIETIAVRTMAKAHYSTQNIGHYGLAFPFYTHFTSPIRRYPDLMVHRLLESYIHGGKSVDKEEYEEKCVHSSDMEKKAADAERASIKYKQAEFLLDKVGQKFHGVISGVSKWGIYVCLDENYCEGMVPLRSLKDDYYELDEENYQVVGYRNGNVYKLGQEVWIRITEIDMNKKQLTFAFLEPQEEPGYRTGKKNRKDNNAYTRRRK